MEWPPGQHHWCPGHPEPRSTPSMHGVFPPARTRSMHDAPASSREAGASCIGPVHARRDIRCIGGAGVRCV